MSAYIALTEHSFDVAPIMAELAAHEHLWNEYKGRSNHPKSPHRDTDDIWLRFAEHNIGQYAFKESEPHKSVWYPCADQLPLTKALAEHMFDITGSKILGGVLLIRIPPGKNIYPHRDFLWHAQVHQKFVVQLHGNARQIFEFNDGGLSALTGQTYTIDNRQPHWVLNPTNEPWINMTVCHREIE